MMTAIMNANGAAQTPIDGNIVCSSAPSGEYAKKPAAKLPIHEMNKSEDKIKPRCTLAHTDASITANKSISI